MKYSLILFFMFMNSFCCAQTEVVTIFKLNAELYIFGDSTWKFSIVEYGDGSEAEIKYSYDRYILSSKFSGSNLIELEQVQNLKEDLITNQFYNLPNDIIQKGYSFHTPEFEIEICNFNKCHKVKLDEHGSENSKVPEDRQKFLLIWNIIMLMLPEFDLPNKWPVSRINTILP